MNKIEQQFYRKYYGSLEGATITRFIGMDHEDQSIEAFPRFAVTFADKSQGEIEISRDEEGNGGGFIFGLPRPETD